MLRPLLTLLAARLFSPVNDRILSAALSFEFFHNATLVHDDIVDDSDERRGTPSLNATYGNKIAVLAGDYLLSLGLRECASAGSTVLVDIMAGASQDLVSGEFLQLGNIQNHSIAPDVYFRIIRAKTAVLFAACAKSGAECAEAAPDDIRNLETFGDLIGICFQIKDDIFDYIAGSEIGKPTGNDMLEGKLTLPVIHALQTAGTDEMYRLAYAVKDGSVTPEGIKRLVEFTVGHDGIAYAVSVMEDYAEQARRLLDRYPDSPVREALLRYVDYVIERNF